MSLPLPPYTYDDPRLTYDEHCFFYDGGYDSACLSATTAIAVRRGGRKKEQKPYINIFVQVCVCKVNGIEFPCGDFDGWTRFVGEDDPITVFINGVALKMKTPYALGYLKQIVNSKNQVDSVNLSLDFINKLETDGIDAVVEPETDPERDIEVKIVEPYSKIEVQCDIIPLTTGSLNISGKIIKNNNKKSKK